MKNDSIPAPGRRARRLTAVGGPRSSARLASAAVCVLLLGAGSTQAQKASRYTAVKTPTKVPSKTPKTPEEQAGCPIPTLEECQAEGYFENDPCGQLQFENESWTCWQLILAAAEGLPTGPSTAVRSLEPSGVAADVALAPQTSEDREVTAPETHSHLGTQSWNRSFAAGTAFSNGNPFAENGTMFASCQEYAFEQYNELNAFWRAVGRARHDYLYTFQVAFDDEGGPSAIGTARMSGGTLTSTYKDVEGQSTGIPSARTGVRNRFFDLKPQSISHTWNFGGRTAATAPPNLLTSMIGYSELGGTVADLIEENREEGTKTLKFFKDRFDAMAVEGFVPGTIGGYQPNTSDDDDGFASGDGYAVVGGGEEPHPLDPQTAAAAAVTGYIDPDFVGGRVRRRLFLREFDELYDLQVERDQLVQAWDDLNEKYGPTWRVSDLLEALEPDDSYTDTFYAEVNPSIYVNTNVWAVTPDEDTGEIGGFDNVGGGYDQGGDDDGPLLDEENAARKAILDSMLAIYEIAQVYGCLESGTTYCEFSLKEFALDAVTHADKPTQAAYEECLEYLPHPFQSNNGHVRVFIDGDRDLQGYWPHEVPELHPAYEALAEQHCEVGIQFPMTPAKYHALVDGTEACQAALPAYQKQLADYIEAYDEAIALYEAKERVAAIPELFDPATGQVRQPGVFSEYENGIGGKYFGFTLGYTYEVSGELPDNDVCQFTFTAGGQFGAQAKVITTDIELLDAHAWFASGEELVDVGVSLLGEEIFDGSNWDTDTTDLPDNVRRERFRLAGSGRSFADGGYKQRFMLGPVPMSIAAGVSGEIGYDTTIDGRFDMITPEQACPQAALVGTVRPYAGVKGYVELSLDAVVLSAGIRGEITLLDLGIPVDLVARADTAVAVGGGPDLRLVMDIGANAEFTMLSGVVSVFANVGPCPLCKRFSKDIVKWDGITLRQPLFNQSYQVSVADLLLASSQ